MSDHMKAVEVHLVNGDLAAIEETIQQLTQDVLALRRTMRPDQVKNLADVTQMLLTAAAAVAEVRDDCRTNVGEIASEVLALRRQEAHTAEEFDAFCVPQECWSLVKPAQRRAELDLLRRHELTPARWNRLVEQKTRAYAAYCMQLAIAED